MGQHYWTHWYSIPSCSIPHGCSPRMSKTMVMSAPSIKADNQLLSKISTERELTPDSTHSCVRQMNTDLGCTFPYTTCMPGTAAAEVSAAQADTAVVLAGGRVTVQPFSAPAAPWAHTWAKLPPVAEARWEPDPLLQPGQAVTSWETCGYDPVSGRKGGRRPGRAGAGPADPWESRSTELHTWLHRAT